MSASPGLAYRLRPESAIPQQEPLNGSILKATTNGATSQFSSSGGSRTDIPRSSSDLPSSSQTSNGTPHSDIESRVGSVAKAQRIGDAGAEYKSRQDNVQHYPAGSAKEMENGKRDGGVDSAWISRGIRVIYPSEDGSVGPEDEGIAGDDGLVGRTDAGLPREEGYQVNAPNTVTDAESASVQMSNNEPSSPVASRTRHDTRISSSEDKRSSRYIRSIYSTGGELDTHSDSPEFADLTQEPMSNGNGIPASRTSTVNTRLELPASQFNDTASPRSSIRTNDKSHREAGERAGGVEDWSGVNEGDVDRFGFVVSQSSPKRALNSIAGTRSGHRVVSSTRSVGSRQSLSRPSMNGSLRYSGSLSGTRCRRSTSMTLRPFHSVRRREMVEAQGMLAPFQEHPAGNISLDDDDATLRARGQLQAKREQKWRKMGTLSGGAMTSTAPGRPVQIKEASYRFDVSDPKLISRTWKGIPDSMRSQAWYSFLETAAAKHKSRFDKQHTEAELVQRFHELQSVDYQDDVQIDLDVPRTIGAHICFRRRYRGGQRLLFRLLHALALHFPETGYVQGMAPIAATLLVYFEEEKAFVVAVRLWLYRGIAWIYGNGFQDLMQILEELDTNWIQKQGGVLAGIHKRLEDLGIPGMTWATKWYLTLFQYTLPYEAHLRVLDVFILLGDSAGLASTPNVDVLHSIATSILLGMREDIMNPQAQFEDVMARLTGKAPTSGSVDGTEGGWGMDAMMKVARLEFKSRKY